MKHCILIKYKSDTDAARKDSLKSEITALFEKLLCMDGIHGVEVISNVIDRPNRYDLLIRITMEQEVLESYDGCDTHKTWKRDYARYLESKAIFDYD